MYVCMDLLWIRLGMLFLRCYCTPYFLLSTVRSSFWVAKENLQEQLSRLYGVPLVPQFWY